MNEIVCPQVANDSACMPPELVSWRSKGISVLFSGDAPTGALRATQSLDEPRLDGVELVFSRLHYSEPCTALYTCMRAPV